MKTIRNIKLIQNKIKEHRLDHIFTNYDNSSICLHIFSAKELLVIQDDAPKYLYILLEGRAKVEPSNENGRLAIIDYIESYDMLGDIEYFNKDNNYHTVKAITDCTLLAIPFSQLDYFLSSSNEFYQILCKNFASKLKTSSIKQSRVLLYPVKNRIAKILLDHAIYEDSNTIVIKYAQTAEFVGVTPRHFRRILSSMEDDGILVRQNSKIIIKNTDALTKLSTCL